MSSSEVERSLAELGVELARTGEREDAAWAFLVVARLALGRGDRLAAARAHLAAVRAVDGAGPLARPSLVPNLLLVESELAAEAGDVAVAARLSERALAGFRAAGDRDGVIAVWTARAERALRAGNAAAAREILDVVLPELDERGDRDGAAWLRVRLGAALAAQQRTEAAGQVLARALEETAPGTAAHVAAGAEAMRTLLDGDAPRDALAVGLAVLDPPPELPALHAEVLVLCAVALARIGEPDLARRFAARADGHDSPGLAEARRRLAGAG